MPVATPDAGAAGVETPRCPITGDRSPVLVQRVSRRFLHLLWRGSHGVVPTPIARNGPAIGLWRSACGLMFFHPPIAGDNAFYHALYRKLGACGSLSYDAGSRPEFVEAAKQVRPGDRVLDVGAGRGGLDTLLPPGAVWQGLDPHFGEEAAPNIARETLEEHAAQHPGAYDMVCAFQVLEHVEQPRRFAEDMLRCLRPGGLLVLCVPLWPSPLTETPNLAINAPPHHLSWWNPEALRALAGALGLEVLRADTLPPPRHAAPLFWLHRLLPRRTGGDRYFRHALSWWAALIAAGLVTRPLLRWRGTPLPRGARSIDAFLVARKPG
ncbi:class I SAM-dependent methyltransferase [Roseomonas sp. BN140053]|uniref:class I SAM-dependent methyltransferase n=1 Tax=Roseomonas sp. BN140053 TaxID=3391898 RepID=UPI0039EB72E7